MKRIGLLAILLAGFAFLTVNCSKSAPAPKGPPAKPSEIKVDVRDGGPVVLTTTTAEFQVLPSGFLQATLLKDGKRLTLDDPGAGSATGGDYLIQDGKELQFTPEFSRAKVLEAIGKLGRGKRVEIPAHPLAAAGEASLECMLTVEVYDDYPNVALMSVVYKNTGTEDFKIDQVVTQQHHFSSKQVDAKAQPYDMWSFQGSSYDWGKDDVQKLTKASAQPNVMGEP